ncbi:MAG: ribosome silencing factor [Gammaproteobacteria bacterium]|nr:MAG: ribosome silencing factor [Gammaproteobacteria bacterium]
MNIQTVRDELTTDQLQHLVVSALEDFKAIDIIVIDVTGHNPLTERMVIASGNSTRHVKSMADNLILKAKSEGSPPLGVEGQGEGEWVLVDLNDVIVHLMLPQTRAFYNLEKLWEVSASHRSSISSRA